MSDPFTDLTHLVPFAVVGASLLGSGHCVAMCGGIVLTVSQKRADTIRYHLGRLIGYCLLGALAGFLGATAFQNQSYAWIPWLATVAFSVTFVWMGVRLWRGQSLHLFHFNPFRWAKPGHIGPELLGFLTAFLPCGWLHTFVLGALATRSMVLGALYLFFFWLGTLPALTLGPLAIHKVMRPLAQKAPKLSAILLITLGFSTLGVKAWTLKSSESCHTSPHSHHEHHHSEH